MITPIPEGGVLLHIGPHKTGTTTVQAALGENRDRLRDQGVLYPGRRNHEMPAAMAIAMGRVDPGRRIEDGLAEWRSLLDEIDRVGPRRSVLSSEFYSEAPPERIAAILEELAGPVHVVVTLRPLSRILASQWQQYCQNDRVFSLEEWLTGVLASPEPGPPTPTFWSRHRHDRLVRRWAEAVGVDNLTAVVVDEQDPQWLLRCFEELLGLDTGSLATTGGSRNRSLTFDEVELWREINARLDRTEFTAADYQRIVRFGAIRRIQERAPDPDHQKLLTPDWAVERADELAARMAEEIQQTGVRILGDPAWLSDTARAPRRGTNDPVEAVDLELAAATTAAVIGRLASFRAGRPDPESVPTSAAVIRRHRAVNTLRRPNRAENLRRRLEELKAPEPRSVAGAAGAYLARVRSRLGRLRRRW